ncbi:exosortase A [Thauera sp. UPWRP]|nr:exosortase A [Thauera sp. UPWRP]
MRHSSRNPDSLEPAGASLAGGAAVSDAATDVGAKSAHTLHLYVLGAALAWLLFSYRDTLMSIVDIWDRSDTYAHGYLIAPISLWLVWRHRHHLRGVPVKPSLLGVLAGAVAGFGWLLGELTSVASVSQFALVGMIVSLIWAVMGTAVMRAYAFPIGFLFFLVPFGEFLFPTMMDWTTEFVIASLRLFGIPVYAEGRSLVIPSGNWQVVEGCSGVRYLIASVVVGSLYAYLNYRSTARRLVFVAVSVALPVLANWVRAWGIVMLGHYSDNKIATGVDHLVYGWVFFGIIMMLLFWVGARWQEDEAPPPVMASGVANEGGSARKSNFVWFALALLAVLAWKPVLNELDRRGEHGPVQFAKIEPQAAWRQVELAGLPEWTPSYSGMRGVQREAWAADDRPVGVYVGYYRDQQPGQELINSENRVLISKDPVWKMTSYGSRGATVAAKAVPWRSTEMSSIHGRMIVWHSYWIGGRWTTNDYLAKLYLALTQLRGAGDDSAVVMLYTPYRENEHDAGIATLERFLAEMGPALGAMLQHTSSR